MFTTGVIFFSTFFILISYSHITIAISNSVNNMMRMTDKFFLCTVKISIAGKLAVGLQGKQVLAVTNSG